MAAALWLLEHSTSPIPLWRLLPKGSSIHLLPTNSLLSLTTDSYIDLTPSPTFPSPDDSLEWEPHQIPPEMTVISTSAYHKITPAGVHFEPEMQGWVTWDAHFTPKILLFSFTIRLFLCEKGSIQTDFLTFSQNVPFTTVLDTIYQRHPHLLDKGNKDLYNVKYDWSTERILHHIHAEKGKLQTFTCELSEEMYALPVLELLSSLSIIVKVESRFKSVLGRILPANSEEKRITGLRNLGNTCYMNAILQCLTHIPSLCTYLYHCQPDWDCPLKAALIELVRDVYDQETDVLNPGLVSKILGKNWEDRTQQDAEEFLLAMLSTLIEEEQRGLTPGNTDTGGGNTLMEMQGSLTGNVLAQLVTGFVETQKVCLQCGYKRTAETCRGFTQLRLGLIHTQYLQIAVLNWKLPDKNPYISLYFQGELGTDSTYSRIESTLTHYFPGYQFYIGTLQNAHFRGPKLPTEYIGDREIACFALPATLPAGHIPLLCDLFTPTSQELATRLVICPGITAISDLYAVLACDIMEITHICQQFDSFYDFVTGNKDSETELATLSGNMSIKICVNGVWMDIEECKNTLQVRTIADLNEFCPGFIRFQCHFTVFWEKVFNTIAAFCAPEFPVLDSVPRENVSTLPELIEHHYRNKPAFDPCPECSLTLSSRISTLKFPNVLIIHIDRSNMTLGVAKKSNSDVYFPTKELDLRKYESELTSSEAVYDLTGVVRHKGAKLTRGHYVAYVKHPTTSRWYHCSDKDTHFIPESEVLATSSASLLFYTRK